MAVLWPVSTLAYTLLSDHTYTDPPSVPENSVSAFVSKPMQQTFEE